MERPTHKIQDTGYYEPHVNTFCGYGDSFDKGFENGTVDDSEVTCKKCLKIIQQDKKVKPTGD